MAVANTGQSISWYKHLRFPHRFLDIEEPVIEADGHRINMGCIKNPRVLSVLSGVIGALTGAFISLVVDSSLFEISVNGFFSFVFGVSLMLIGAMILFRVLPQPGQSINAVRIFIIGFSILVIFSGIFCFFLERDWITVLKPNAKIPMYIVLGTSLCFALTFSIVDLVNQGICSECPCARDEESQHQRVRRPVQPYMQSSAQMSIILIGSIIMGAVFGFSFGILDVEDDTWQHQRFSKDQSIASCLGAIIGAIIGIINQQISQRQQDLSSHEAAYENLSENEEDSAY